MTKRAHVFTVIAMSLLATAGLKVGATHDARQADPVADAARAPRLAVIAAGVAPASTPPGADPTFAADIAPIVYGHCVVCHRPGQSAPFPLISYDDVKKRGGLIVAATSRRYMPPWHATPAPDVPEFRDDRRLSEVDLATLKAWVDAGMPAGDLAKAPKPPVFPEGWALGKPDAELAFPTIIDVPADGPDLYRNIVLPLDLPEDRWITAVDFGTSVRVFASNPNWYCRPCVAKLPKMSVTSYAAA